MNLNVLTILKELIKSLKAISSSKTIISRQHFSSKRMKLEISFFLESCLCYTAFKIKSTLIDFLDFKFDFKLAESFRQNF